MNLRLDFSIFWGSQKSEFGSQNIACPDISITALLQEKTSNILLNSGYSEREVQKSLEKLIKNRTTM